MRYLLRENFYLSQKHNLYLCLHKLLTHKTELFSFLQQRCKPCSRPNLKSYSMISPARPSSVIRPAPASGGMAIAGTNAPIASRSSSL